MDDPVFVRFFNEFIKKHKITEYYLLNANGSFLFLDNKGNPSWLVVKDDDAMNADVFDAEMCDEKVDPKIIDALKNREKILFLYSDEDHKRPPTQWRANLFAVKKLQGKSTYYYAYIEDSINDYIDKKRVLSYNEYLV